MVDSFLSATGVAQPAGCVPVAVSTTNPLPVTLGGGGLTSVIGAQAAGVAPTEDPVLVAGWDGILIRRILTDASGAVVVTNSPGTPWQTNITGAGIVLLQAAPGAGLRVYVTALQLTSPAVGVIQLDDGVTTHWAMPVLVANTSYIVTFPTPLRMAVNTLCQIQGSGAGAESYNAQGYIAP